MPVRPAPLRRSPLSPTIRRNLLGVGLRVVAMALFAAMGGMVKWSGDQGVPLLEIIFFRNAFAFPAILIYVALTSGFGALRTRNLRGHATRAVVGLVGMTFGFAALLHLPLTEATALQFATPLIMTALSAPILGEPIGRHRWAAVAVGFMGVLIMIRPDASHMNPVGAALGLTGAFGAAAAMIAIRQIARTETSAAIVFYYAIAGTLLGLASLPFGWVAPDPRTLAVMVLMGTMAGAMQILLTESLRLAPVGVVAPFDYTQLVWAGVIGFLVWGEAPRPATLAGAAVVIASGGYILFREMRRIGERGAV